MMPLIELRRSLIDLDHEILLSKKQGIAIKAIKYVTLLQRVIDQIKQNDESTCDQLVESINKEIEMQEVNSWEEIIFSLIAPEISDKGDPYLRWQAVTKRIRSSEISPLQLLIITIYLAKIKKYNAALYGLWRTVRETELSNNELLIAFTSVFSNLGSNQNSHFSQKNELQINQELINIYEQLISLLSDETDKKANLLEIIEKSQALLDKGKEHGHNEFIYFCKKRLIKKLKNNDQAKSWLVEVGCSREIIEGQNSTKSLIEFADEYGLSFLGIDLDEENINALRRDFKGKNVSWISGKGEEVLKNLDYRIAAIYLDAYDISHGNHSSVRQSKYRNEYGKEINDIECHKMHLDATINSLNNIEKEGIIGFDDTWIDGDSWHGKGATAIPWLINNGWSIELVSERSVIMVRKK